MNLEKYKYIAHRGLYNRLDTPENSMKSFENAILKGYAIELDVNMTNDGHLVVFHDESLKRMNLREFIEFCIANQKRIIRINHLEII